MKNAHIEKKQLLNSLRFACSATITDICDKENINYHALTGMKTWTPDQKALGQVKIIELEEYPESTKVTANLQEGLNLLESLQKGDVLFIKNPSNKFAYFGELMSLYCDKKEVSSVVIDGLTRDTASFFHRELKIFYKGSTPVDIVGRGRIKSINKPIKYNNYTLEKDDYIFSDVDACVMIKEKDLLNIRQKIINDIEDENKIQEQIRLGKPLGEIIKIKPL